MLKPHFNQLNRIYSSNYKNTHNCTMPFSDTSAIRMCEALASLDSAYLQAFQTSAKPKCPHGFIRNVRDLVGILSQPQLLGVTPYQWRRQANDKRPPNATGKRGIIAFLGTNTKASHYHIDIWDRKYSLGDEYWDADKTLLWILL